MKCSGLISNTFRYIILILIVSHYFLLVVDYEHCDLSNLDTTDITNKKVPAKLQHEFSSRLVVEFTGIININFITLIVTSKKSVYNFKEKRFRKDKKVKVLINTTQ